MNEGMFSGSLSMYGVQVVKEGRLCDGIGNDLLSALTTFERRES
jgi:hypothetical protein